MLSVIYIPWVRHKIYEFTRLRGDNVKFETIEPSDGTMASDSQSIENFIVVNVLVMANAQWGAINKADAGTLSGCHAFQVNGQGQ